MPPAHADQAAPYKHVARHGCRPPTRGLLPTRAGPADLVSGAPLPGPCRLALPAPRRTRLPCPPVALLLLLVLAARARWRCARPGQGGRCMRPSRS